MSKTFWLLEDRITGMALPQRVNGDAATFLEPTEKRPPRLFHRTQNLMQAKNRWEQANNAPDRLIIREVRIDYVTAIPESDLV